MEKENTYSKEVICDNCITFKTIHVEKGTSLVDHLKSNNYKCRNCNVRLRADPKAHEAVMYPCQCKKRLGRIRGFGKWYCESCPQVTTPVKVSNSKRKTLARDKSDGLDFNNSVV